MTQRRIPIRSTKLRRHAKGQPCTLRFACCDGGGETTVLAHIRDRHKGMGVKASDLSACYSCAPCHDLLDHHPHKIDPVEFYRAQLTALQETLERLYEAGLIIVPVDAVTPAHEAPVKARPPVGQRTKIPARKDAWPAGRKLQSRPFPREEVDGNKPS